MDADGGGRGRRCQRALRTEVGGPVPRGRSALLDRSSAPRLVANRTAPERVAVIVKLRGLRMTAAEIAETLVMPLSTVSGILTRLGLGRLGRIGLEQPVRYERSRPGELVHVDVKKLGRIERGVGKRWRDGQRQHYTGATPTATGNGAARPAGSTSTSPSTTTRASPTPKCSPTNAHRPPPPFCVEPSPITAAAASALSADHRQRQRLCLHHPRARLPRPRDPPPPHAPSAPPDQRQSRALHPHHARRLGLRRHLWLKRRTHSRP